MREMSVNTLNTDMTADKTRVIRKEYDKGKDGSEVILYVVLRALTKSDEYLVEIILDSLLLPDDLYP